MALENRDWSINMKDSKTLFTTQLMHFNKFNKDNWLKMLNIKNGDTVLEIGCGAGGFCQRIKEFLPDCKVYGIDEREGHINFAIQSAKKVGVDINFSVGNVKNLSFVDGKFDVVFSYNLVDTISIAYFLPEQYRVLKTHGKLVSLSLNGSQCTTHQVVIPEIKEERLWEKLATASSTSNANLHKLSVYDFMTAIKRQGFERPKLFFENILWYCPDDSRYDSSFAKQMLVAFKNTEIDILKSSQSQTKALSASEFHTLETLITNRYEMRFEKLENGEICWDYSSLFVKGIVAEKAEKNIYNL